MPRHILNGQYVIQSKTITEHCLPSCKFYAIIHPVLCIVNILVVDFLTVFFRSEASAQGKFFLAGQVFDGMFPAKGMAAIGAAFYIPQG